MRISAVIGACVLVVIGGIEVSAQPSATAGASASRPPSRATSGVEKVTGIGGFFFRASDPQALAEWYERHLGINPTPTSYSVEPWRQEAGPAVFAPFPADTKYFGNADKQWMINLRVRNLDAMVAQLTRAGVAVQVDPTEYPNGRFARLQDPEGNPIELWQPRDPSRPTTP